MANLKKIVITIICCIHLYGCSNSCNHVSEVKSIECNETSIPETLSDLICNVQFLALQNDSKHILSKIDEIYFENDLIYIGDFKAKKVFVYNYSGELVSVLSRYGRGPGEYIEFQAFDVDEDYIYILDGAVNKILTYDSKTLDYIREDKLNFFAWDFVKLADEGFLFAYAPMYGNKKIEANHRYRIIVTDQNFKVQKRFFKYTENEYDAICLRHYLSVYKDQILYNSFNEDVCHSFSLTDGNLVESLAINFSNSIPINQRSEISHIKEMKFSYQMRVPIRCNDLLAFTIAMGDGGQCIILDQTNMSFSTNSEKSLFNNVFGIISSFEDYLVADWQSANIYDFMISRGFTRADIDTERMIRDDSPYLVFYRMK